MKKLTNYIFAALLLLITAGLQAQVVEVCAGDGTDSVTLSLAQYQYGNIQWQYSEDTLTWTDILGAHDTVCRFLPERECYYRARIEYPNCPVDTTQVTHILFTPTANAGPDRILNEGYVTTLFGNKVEDGNTRCMWQVIEGDSPDLEDPTYRNSRFTGPDTLYKLTWTVANACGVSVDTVEIRYVHTVMYDAIAIVDTTDIILSDSAERASGIYRIVFSNPAPNITDSTILMGMDGDDFLRKVIDFEWFGDTCEIYASPADILDILVEGAINLEVPLNFNSTGQRNENRHIYTRAQLMNDPRFQSGQWNSLFQEVINDNQVVRARESRYLFANPVTISGNILIRNLSVSFSDDAKYDADIYSDPNDNTVRAFAYLMGDLHTDFILELSQGSGSVSYDIPTPAGVSIINPFVPNSKLFEVGLFVPIEFTGTVQAQEMMEIPIRVTKPVGMMGTYHGSRLKLWKIFRDMDVHYSSEKAVVEKTELDFSSNSFSCQLSLSVGAKLAMSILELGLNFSVLPTLSYAVCYGTDGFRTEKVQSEVLLKLSGEIWDPNDAFGAGAGLDLWNHSCDQMTWYSPYRISANTNRNLVQPSANSYIQDPIYVHVYNQDERPVRSGRKVLFEATGGVVSATPSGNGSASAFATTNASGVAQIYWKPLSSNASLKASVLDCEGYHVKGSPLYFYSNGVADLCLNSTLSLAIGNNGRFITSGGTSPFLYSSDGVSWLPEINMSYPLAAGTYFVKDANGCIASTTYTVQEATPSCDLTTNTYQNGMRVRFVVNNGTAPYHFYVDGVDQAPSGTTQRVLQYDFTTEGSHSLSVTDANGCTTSTLVNLTDGITPPTVVTIERYNTANQVYDAVMGAVTDNGGAEITERGIQWSLSSDMSNATMVASNSTAVRYVCQITGVTPGTTYYARAYATNARSYTGYGRIITLTMPGSTPGPGSTTSCGVSSVRANETGSNGTITAVRDHQNNSYAVVQIGNQCWLKENMRCTTSPSTGANMVENPAVETNMSSTERRAYYYDNNPANAANGYGLLYNWPAAMDGSTTAGSRGICPEGWHLPTDAEWTALMNTAVSIYQPGVTPTSQNMATNAWLDGGNTAISSMLSGGTDWQTDDSGEATPGNYSHALRNVTGFIAVPAGTYDGGFYDRGQLVYGWSSSPYASGLAWVRAWVYGFAGAGRGYGLKEDAFAVRCLRN